MDPVPSTGAPGQPAIFESHPSHKFGFIFQPATGQNGQIGAPAPSPVGADLTQGPETVQTRRHSLEEQTVLVMHNKMVPAMS